ncbi:MAG: DUF3575 domain-containing protein [Alistipes sp.]
MIKKAFVVIVALFLVVYADKGYAQLPQNSVDTTTNYLLYFRFDRALLEKDYRNNKQTLSDLDTLLNSPAIFNSLDSIAVVAAASPEGNLEHNSRLAKQRAEAVTTYILWKHPQIDRSIIHQSHINENWDGLKALVEADEHIPHKEQVLKVINTDVNLATKEWRLKQIGGGGSWRYIEQNFLRSLRSGTTCVVFYKKVELPTPQQPPEPETIPTPEPIPEPTPDEIVTPPQPVAQQCIAYERRPLFALKTNLLFDAATALNIEVEVPIGKRWSVSGEWMFPWWQSASSNWTMQLMTGQLAVKYWLGDRDRRATLCGWSLGLYGGAGKYDFQFFDKDGVQGEFFNGGLQCGFAHSIGRSWRLEYLVGIGYLQSDYKQYDKVLDTKYGDIKVFRSPWETKRQKWFGPTSAKISLVWLLHYKTVKKGGDVR